MTDHSPKILQVRKAADGLLDILIGCCDDPSTRSWHTLCNLHLHTEDSIRAHIEERKTAVANLHASSLAAENFIRSLIENGNPNPSE